MARIKQLSKNLINQIAAGEVIERPMSVVKEIVENSIDAGATKISIEISNDCRDIRVADNGSGIHPDDIPLAFSKHATSKIDNDEDLYNISTLGFRGEALPSIISISKLTCTTRKKEFETGMKVECANSEVTKTETGCAIGTIMSVRDLFYNVPARLKFLRNPKTEFSYIQELIQALALINPQISFDLKNNGKSVLQTKGLNSPTSTIKDVFSKDLLDNLCEVSKTDKLSNLKITGFVSTPNYTRSSKKGYFLYINSRTVKCPVIQKSVDMAYRNLIAKGKYPFVLINLEIPPQDVDVNVHPTKKEVRYKNTNQVFSFVYSAIENALSNSQKQAQESEKIVQFTDFSASDESFDKFLSTYKPPENIELQPKRTIEHLERIKPFAESDFKKPSAPVQKVLISQEEVKMDNDENIIGQYKNTYILIETDEGLEIVDQHIADERYIYEKLQEYKETASQILFISDVIEVSASEAQLIQENKEKFEKFGYQIEVLNDKEVIFKKVPQLLSKVNPKEILADILENLSGNIDGLEEKILITTSCKAAVKAHQPLSMFQMQEIIKRWRKCKNPHTCPHGRTISKILPYKQIASFFQRSE